MEEKLITDLDTGEEFFDKKSGTWMKIKAFDKGMVEVKDEKGKRWAWPNKSMVLVNSKELVVR